jgi:uncharacterized protein (DUF4213/DUF364 family)
MLWGLGLNPSKSDDHNESAAELITRVEAVAIAGTTLVNHILHKQLTLCYLGILIMVLGLVHRPRSHYSKKG